MSAGAYGPITLERDQGVATLTMADAAGRNALDAGFVAGFEAAFADVAADTGIAAVVLRGLPDVFCAGASRALLESLVRGEVNVAELGLPRRLLACPVPVIAAMEGSAVGGGFALGLAADIVILSETARYGFNFMDLGLTPGMGVTWLAGDRLGAAVGDELIYSTEYRRGRAFRAAPGINHVVPAAKVDPLAQDLAARVAEKPRDALVMLKANQCRARLAAFDAARAAEMRMHEACLARPDLAERIAAQYLD